MEPGHRRDAAIALAMLPVGAVITVAAVLAIAGLAGLVVFLAITRPPGWLLLELWALAAMMVALRNTLAGIETMSSFEPRPALVALLWSGAILAACPWWWQ